MSSGDRVDQSLESLALEITDGRAIDWSERETAGGPSEDRLRAMRLISEVLSAHDSVELPPDPGEPPLFRWGGLEVREKVAEGGFGEVYRAFDPRLQRSVALKLRRSDAPGSAAQWIDEARRLARVKHPNVLTIHGAEVRDERAGIETEWIEGVTLEQWLEDNGPASAAEASLLGSELCRALGAVHRSGLIHGDVKTANVMRERGGRLVLMDFGSARAGGRAVSGTPLYASPEVLAGEEATGRSDVYSVGALLYRLVSGKDPYTADSLSQLRKRQADPPTELGSLRPDLPGEFVAAVMGALAVDPLDRPESVAALERRLAATSAARRRGWLWPVAIAAAAVLVFFVMQIGSEPSLLSVEQSQWLRVANGSDHPLPAHARLEPGDHLAYRFGADETLHVYVLNEDADGRTYILFPAPGNDLDNPLAGDRVHRLPGTRAGESFDWVVTNLSGSETFLVVAAREPLAALEAAIRRTPAADPDRPPVYAQLDETGYAGLRGIGGMGRTSGTGSAPAGRLAAIATTLQGQGAPPDIWVQILTVGPAD